MSLSPKPIERPRRFYKAVDVAPREDGYAVLLDGRVPKTPGGRALITPTEALAALLAKEWAEQTEFIHLDVMHAVRLANTAIDRLGEVHAATAAEVARYAESDVLCYFAEHPASLVARQNAEWGPLLDWARDDLGLEMRRVSGLLHQPQPPATLDKVKALALGEDNFALAGLAFAAPLFASAVLALAVRRGRLTGEEAFAVSRLDELFQEERWGVDEEAAKRIGGLQGEARMIGGWFTALT